MEMMEVKDVMGMKQNGCSAVYVLEGRGKLFLGGKNAGQENGWQEEISQGDQFFLPAGTEELQWLAEEGSHLKLIQCFGPEIK